DQINNQAAIWEALRLFRSEYRQMGWMLEDMDLPQLDWADPHRVPDELEIKLLHLLVDMDGDFEMEWLPQEGERHLLSRAIYLRLKILGLNEQVRIDAPFSSTIVEEKIRPLRHWMGLQDDLIKMVNLIGNVPALIRTVWQLGALDRQVVCFKYQPLETFDPAFAKKVGAESSQQLKREDEELEKISQAAEALIPKKEKAKLRKTISKQLQRQSESEQLRAQIKVILSDMQKELNEQLQEGSQFEKQIQLLQTQIVDEQRKHDHLKEDLKALKRQEKQMKGWLDQRDQLEKERQKKEREIDPQVNYQQELALQISLLQQLIEKQNQADDALKHRFQVPIQSAQKKIQVLQQKIKIKQTLTELAQKRRTIQDQLQQFPAIQTEIEATKKQIDELGARLKTQKRNLSKLNKQKEQEQKAFAEARSQAQKAIQKKKAKFDDILEKLNNIPRRFRRELSKYLAPDFYQTVSRELLDRQNSTFFDRQLQNRYNLFLIRLIQLHQWTSGYYNGMLDSDLGERTFNSIREIDEDLKSLKLRFVLYQIDAQKGTWLLNVRYFFDEMIASLDSFQQKPDFDTVVTTFEKEINDNPKIRSKKKEFDRQWRKAIRETKQDLKQNVVRRIYFGIRSIARSIVRGIKRIIGLIFSGIKKLFRLLRNFVHLLYREIREGLRKFSQGIGFLFGKRTIKTNTLQGNLALITRYDFDCDVISIADTKNPTLFKQHIAKNYEVVHNLDFALMLVGKVIDWVFKFTLFGYAGILIRIGLFFRRLARKFIRKGLFGLGLKLLG
ncbi:MAG: hypothetical protein AAF985_23810, partial [Bacteroidota bacterium]